MKWLFKSRWAEKHGIKQTRWEYDVMPNKCHAFIWEATSSYEFSKVKKGFVLFRFVFFSPVGGDAMHNVYFDGIRPVFTRTQWLMNSLNGGQMTIDQVHSPRINRSRSSRKTQMVFPRKTLQFGFGFGSIKSATVIFACVFLLRLPRAEVNWDIWVNVVT